MESEETEHVSCNDRETIESPAEFGNKPGLLWNKSDQKSGRPIDLLKKSSSVVRLETPLRGKMKNND